MSVENSPEYQKKRFENLEKPLKFIETKKILQESYNYEEMIQSTTLDIVSTYLKGQKILYIEAKTYCEQILYGLMLPTIFISAACSVISGVLKDIKYSSIVVCILAAINSFMLAIVNYLKLDAKAEAHKISASSFEKLQSICDFNSGRVLFTNEHTVEEEKLDAMRLMNDIELKVKEIKEKNQFVLPEYIRYKFPILYSTNVFAEVKKKQNDEIILINDLKNEINNCLDLEKKSVNDPSLKSELEKAKEEREKVIEKIIKNRDEYLKIDKDFKDEIDKHINENLNNRCNPCKWFRV
jgi:hypothetical protein